MTTYTLRWIDKGIVEEGLTREAIEVRLGDSDYFIDLLEEGGSDGVVQIIEEHDEELLDDDSAEWDDGDYYGDTLEADAEVLASAGMGTDEDYGYFGGDEW